MQIKCSAEAGAGGACPNQRVKGGELEASRLWDCPPQGLNSRYVRHFLSFY